MSSRHREILFRLTVLAALCAVASASRVAQDGVSSGNLPGRNQTLENALPLAPWLQGLDAIATAPCIVLEAANWGLGSNFNMVLWATALLKQQRPDITIYYSHRASLYQCSNKKNLEAVLRPGNNVLKTTKPPANCVRLPFVSHYKWTANILSKGLHGLLTESQRHYQAPINSFQLSIERHLMLDAVFQAMCPVMVDFWHLAPDLQDRVNQVKLQLQNKQRPIIAIHARGGDKRTELGKYVDPKTGQYPMLEGMQRLASTHPGIHALGPICLLFGDDYNYAQKVRQMAKDTLNCNETILRVPDSRKTGYSLTKFRSLDVNGRCQATGDYLVDIELMGWSHFFVANHRANADTTATFLRKCKYFHDYTSTIQGTGAPRFTFWAR